MVLFFGASREALGLRGAKKKEIFTYFVGIMNRGLFGRLFAERDEAERAEEQADRDFLEAADQLRKFEKSSWSAEITEFNGLNDE